MTKATNAEVSRRIRFVQRLLLRGRTRLEIQQFAAKKWGLTERPIDEYIARANEINEEINLQEMKNTMALITRNQWKLFRASVDSGNLALARQLLMDLAKLKGLDQETINHRMDIRTEYSGLSEEDFNEIVNPKSIQ